MAITADMLLGRGLVMVTGQIGSGKTHYVVTMINEIRKTSPETTVITDITGINIEGVEYVEVGYDWHNAPVNSIVIYDEAQKQEVYSNSNRRINSDPRVTDLTTVRKEGLTIVFITQDPSFLHTAITKLVKTHYHVSNPFETREPKVFEFNKAVRQIDDKGRYQSQAVNQFTYKMPVETDALYESINVDKGAVHKKTRKRPKKFYYMVGFIVFLVAVAIPAAIWGLSIVYHFIRDSDKTAANTKTNSTTTNTSSLNTSNGAILATQAGGTVTVRKDLYDHFLRSKDYVDIVSDENIRPAMVVAINDDCKAYNRFGDVLLIDKSDCIAMSNDHSLIPRSRKSYPVAQVEQNNVALNSPASTVPSG